MVTIDIGDIGDIDKTKVHHENVGFDYYLIILVLIKISYIIPFYVIDSMSLLVVACYSIILSSLFGLLIKIKWQNMTIVRGMTNVAIIEMTFYFTTIFNYVVVSKTSMHKEYILAAIIEISALFLFSLLTLCVVVKQVVNNEKGDANYYLTIGIIVMIFSLLIYLYTIKVFCDDEERYGVIWHLYNNLMSAI